VHRPDTWLEMSASDDQIEQTLFIAREANVYRIPPRPGAGGHRSGEWKVADKLFTGRLRVISKGDICEVRLEDVNR
jgi:adaptin ear-binding coat-associated protein 1/2